MKSRLALGCAALLVFECVGAAWATNGGPELTEVLGWDPAEGKVFFRTHYVDETDRQRHYRYCFHILVFTLIGCFVPPAAGCCCFCCCFALSSLVK